MTGKVHSIVCQESCMMIFHRRLLLLQRMSSFSPNLLGLKNICLIKQFLLQFLMVNLKSFQLLRLLLF